MSRSKEDILNERDLIFYGRVPAEDQVDGEKEKVLEAMDEYAKQEAIGFFKWADKNAHYYTKDEESLYDLYFQQSNQKP